jgi:hypothetical protein
MTIGVDVGSVGTIVGGDSGSKVLVGVRDKIGSIVSVEEILRTGRFVFTLEGVISLSGDRIQPETITKGMRRLNNNKQTFCIFISSLSSKGQAEGRVEGRFPCHLGVETTLISIGAAFHQRPAIYGLTQPIIDIFSVSVIFSLCPDSTLTITNVLSN